MDVDDENKEEDHQPVQTDVSPADLQRVLFAKIATAVAIISLKPDGLTGEQYAQILFELAYDQSKNVDEISSRLENEVVNLNLRVEDLEKELQERGGNFYFDSSSNVTSAEEGLNIAVPSQGAHKFYKSYQFLQTYFQLSESEKNLKLESLNENLSFLFKCFRNLINSDSLKSLGTSFKVTHRALKTIAKLVKTSKADSRICVTTISHVEKFLNEITTSIYDADSFLNSTVSKQFLVDLTGILMTSSPFVFIRVLENVMRRIYDFTNELREWKLKAVPFDPVHAENVFFLIKLCQNSLRAVATNQDLKSNLDSEKFAQIRDISDDCMLHISAEFPMFCHSMWSLQDLLENIPE